MMIFNDLLAVLLYNYIDEVCKRELLWILYDVG